MSAVVKNSSYGWTDLRENRRGVETAVRMEMPAAMAEDREDWVRREIERRRRNSPAELGLSLATQDLQLNTKY